MKSPESIVKKLRTQLKRELVNPKLNEIKKAFLEEKLQTVQEILVIQNQKSRH